MTSVSAVHNIKNVERNLFTQDNGGTENQHHWFIATSTILYNKILCTSGQSITVLPSYTEPVDSLDYEMCLGGCFHKE